MVVASSLGGNARITDDATRHPACPPRSNLTLTVPSGHETSPRTQVPSSTCLRTSCVRKASVRRAVPPTTRIEGGCCAKPVACRRKVCDDDSARPAPCPCRSNSAKPSVFSQSAVRGLSSGHTHAGPRSKRCPPSSAATPKTRPPTRSRASSRVTSRPSRSSRHAATRPDKPAPTTTTCAGGRRASGTGEDESDSCAFIGLSGGGVMGGVIATLTAANLAL